MRAPAGPGSPAAPEPPPRFRGAFVSDPEALERVTGASGPFRLPPRAVALPADAEDVARLVSWAGAEGLALVPRGAGTGMPGGNVGHGVVVDLSTLGGSVVACAETGILEAGPGVTGAQLAAAAEGMGRFLPPLPSSADRCTLGGMVANNAAGARSFGAGAVHAWVEGLEGVFADGATFRLGAGERHPRFDALAAHLREILPDGARRWPRVRKNSSGYPLDRFLPEADPLQLLTGSEGTLALLTRVRLRTEPLPPARTLILLPVPDETALDPAVAGIAASGASVCEFFGGRFLDLSGVRLRPDVGPLVGDHPALLLVEAAGDPGAAEETTRRVLAVASELGVSARVGRSDQEREALWTVRHAASPVVASRAAQGLVSMQFIEDSVVPQGSLARYLDGLATILEEEETDAVVFGHAGDGNVHVNPLVDVRRAHWRERVARILDRTATLVASLGGTLSGEHGDGRLRAPFHVRIFGRELDAAFRRVKEALDPAGILNPGVIAPLPGQDPLEGLSPLRRTSS